MTSLLTEKKKEFQKKANNGANEIELTRAQLITIPG